ncbi:MAG: pyridoxal phosphate-dependent decarboxylase family protein [Actinomycetota bacterium]
MNAPEPFGELDWDSARARAFADGVADIWEELLRTLPKLPVTRRETEAEVHEAVAIDVPEEPMAEDELLAYLREVVLEHSMYPGHPRFYAYISGAGTVPGAAADLLAAGLNQNLGGWRLSPAATEIELTLTRWFADRFRLPDTAGGLIVSGGAMASFVALKTARDRTSGWDVRRDGVRAGPPLAIYQSAEAHVVNDRAADMLGLGMGSVRHVPVDGAFRMRVDLLREAIRIDRERGVRPIAVVGSGGTVATGSIDPLPEIADVCAEEGLWFHVDAAYGGPAVLADDLRPLLAGIERADSIAFDPHKWLYTPHSGGCVLVRDLRHLGESFVVHPTYTKADKGRTGWGLDLMEHGPQFSRGFWALKVWVSLLAHGRRAYAARISHDAALARYLAARAAEREEFEPAAPVTLSIACFRYVPPSLGQGSGREEYLNELNERLLTEIVLDGRVFCSNAVLDGRYVLRACIVNFRTEAGDLDALLDVAAGLGARLDAELRPDPLKEGAA